MRAWLSSPVVRRVLRSLLLWAAGQAAMLAVGRLAARRFDRLVVFSREAEVPAPSRVRFDAGMVKDASERVHVAADA